MEKSAIALRMTDGTGQFIKDYMFPKGTGEAIEKLSEQLGAYRDICERIEDMKKRIEMLKEVQAAGLKLTAAKAEEIHNQNLIRCLDIEDAKDHIAGWSAGKETVDKELTNLNEKKEELKAQEKSINTQLIQVKADLKSSDLGQKKSI